MPNHIHGIINNLSGGQRRPPLHQIIQGYKSVTTRLCYEFKIKSLWQHNYYDRVIRSREEYLTILEYVKNNPLK
ncbi:MAG TPA: hypothetical protein GXZ78_05170 [Eubacteriaceae bacterium]|jgi:putative transposase|nr:hypothetical protein [Eubacteriaceae bacterium]